MTEPNEKRIDVGGVVVVIISPEAVERLRDGLRKVAEQLRRFGVELREVRGRLADAARLLAEAAATCQKTFPESGPTAACYGPQPRRRFAVPVDAAVPARAIAPPVARARWHLPRFG